MANNWIKQDPFRDIKYRFDDVDAVFLDDNDLNALVSKKIVIPRIDQVRGKNGQNDHLSPEQNDHPPSAQIDHPSPDQKTTLRQIALPS